jgi:glycosyltransferase involved in cell wall biosynthesis
VTAQARVSVALCTRNGARFVEAQLLSILGQTHPVNEIVVSDDGSHDGTIEVVRRVLAENADRARVDQVILNPEPLGVAANFAQAISASGGALIALSDQDDVWHPERVARAVAEFDRDPAVLMTHSDARLVDADAAPLGLRLFEALELDPAERESIAAGRLADVSIRRNIATGATMTISRELFEYARPIPANWIHDEWFAMLAALRGGVVVIDEPLIDYRQHGSNEIGVREPTLRHKMRRVLQPRGDRNRILAQRAAVLRDRVAGLSGIDSSLVGLVNRKAEFEALRAGMPEARWRRAGAVLRLARSGRYDHLASRGRADIVRDLLQPA